MIENPLEWMAWTLPTAIFFATIASMLVAMTVWEVVSPTVQRRGFLPISTTRGDRFFIGLLTSAFIHVGWIAFTELSLWIALAIAAVWMVIVMRFG
jgi:predicted small integral membrane protein